jgi:iron complex outermembrane receptor protein
MRSHLAYGTLVSMLLTGAAMPAWAQTSAAAPVVDEIIVTAQRRAESLQDVPVSVAVASANTLQARNYTNPAQLVFLVPSLQLTNFQASPGATNFSVRGIGTASFSHLVEPSVATVIDDIVMSRPEMGVAEFSDLSRVEVLNGPQGMLFGKNASAGLVNIVTTRPKIGVFEGFSNASVESLAAAAHPNVYKVDTTLNIPLSSIAAARVTAFYSDEDPLIGNTVAGGFSDFGRKEYGARAKLLIEPTDNWSIYLGADFADSDGMGTGNFTPRSEGPALAGLHASAGVVPSPDNLYQSSDAPSDIQYQIGGAQANVSYTFADGTTLTDIVGYRSYRANHTIDLDLAQIDLLNHAGARFKFEQVTNELRLASRRTGDLTYQGGIFYYRGFDRRQDRLRGNIALGAPPPGKEDWLGIDAQDDLHSQSWAGYAQGSYKATQKLTLTAGGRVTRDKVRFNGGYTDANVVISVAGGGPGPQNFQDTQTHTDFSWRTSAQYALTPEVNAYVTAARGYKGPGYNLSWAGSPGAAPVGPETSMNYEFGLRSTLFGRLLLNGTVYLENFDDFQVQSFKSSGVPGVGSFIIQNAGSLRARGVEANFSLRIDPKLSLSGSAAYNDAVYRRFAGAPCYAGQTPAQGCVAGAVDAAGHRLVNAPAWTGTLGVDYRYPLASGWTVLTHADVYARSKSNFSPNGDPNTLQGGYAVANASLALAGGDERWTLRAFCRNCFDERFVTAIGSTVVGGPGDYGQSFGVDSFRSLGVAVNVRY